MKARKTHSRLPEPAIKTSHTFVKVWKDSLRIAAVGSLAFAITGCTSTPGSRSSIWPTRTAGSPTSLSPGAATGVAGTLASTTQVVKGQFSSMGTAVSSAYGKAKTAIVSPFNGTADAGAGTGDATALNNKPTLDPELHVMKGQLDEQQGNYSKALDSYSKALELEPKNPAALLSTARLYERQNEKDKAVEFYQKASAVAPNNASIFADLGNLHARSGNLPAARAELQKAVNLDPKSTSHRSALAGVMLDSGNSEAAMTELSQVNSPAMANYQMAYLHFSRKNVPATQQYLNSALQIDPNLKPARDLMASMGGAQKINQMAQGGQQAVQQAQGIYQQAGAIGSNIQGLFNAAPASYQTAPGTSSTPAAQQLPPASPSNGGLMGLPPHQQASGVPPSSLIRR